MKPFAAYITYELVIFQSRKTYILVFNSLIISYLSLRKTKKKKPSKIILRHQQEVERTERKEEKRHFKTLDFLQ